jgi:6,7-dimethyl-8-ribityllumazine synthase
MPNTGSRHAGRRIGIAAARFNQEITERLVHGAREALLAQGLADTDITVCWVAGVFELPLCCKWLCTSGRHDAVVALGAVIRGETDHYHWVCQAATDGILRVQLDTGVPIGFGVLTCDDEAQALARAGGNVGNKGADAAVAALEMAVLRTQQCGTTAPPERPRTAGR